LCLYHPASLIVKQKEPFCVSRNDFSFLLDVNASHCGKITITLTNSSGDQVGNTTTGGFLNGQHTLSFDILKAYERMGKPVPPPSKIAAARPYHVKVTGSRPHDKSKFDEPSYVAECTVEFGLDLKFDNFFYCPRHDVVYGGESDIYEDRSEYFEFDERGVKYNWDEDCPGTEAVRNCSYYPTDCVDKTGTAWINGTIMDADEDKEIEVCTVKHIDIQGGWLDPDSGQETCEYANYEWMKNCVKIGSCHGSTDDFDGKGARCCGDDVSENVVSSRIIGIAEEYRACCGASNVCADKNGYCRPVGYETCHSDGKLMTCESSGNWRKSTRDCMIPPNPVC